MRSILLYFWALAAFGKPLVVSLGCNCGVAGSLRQMGLREAAYPFDWIHSLDLVKLVEILNDDFSLFFDPRFLQKGHGGILYHNYYHLAFCHEGEWNESRMEAFQEKYRRRVERFQEIKHCKEKVYFIRMAYSDPVILKDPWYMNPENLEISEWGANQLFESLESLFPGVSLTLLILNLPRFTGDREKIMWKDRLIAFRDSQDLFNDLQQWCGVSYDPMKAPQTGDD